MSHTLLTLRVFSSRLIRGRLFLVAFAGIVLFSGTMHASLIPSLVEGSPTRITPTLCRYDYQLQLSANERLDPAATNGNTCQGGSTFNTPCTPPGTFFTIYDIPGLINGTYTNNATTPVGGTFTPTIQNQGLTPSNINATGFDSAAIQNVSYTYTGPVVTGPVTFTGFSVFSTACGINPFGSFSSQDTNNTFSMGIPTDTNGTTNQVTGSLTVPVINTAATVNIGGRITTPSGKGVRGIKVTLTGLGGVESRTVLSGQYGSYSFPDIEVGETYTIRVSGKRYTFTQNTQLHTVLDEINDINFTAFSIY